MDYNYDLQDYPNSVLFQGSPSTSLGCALPFQTAEATVPDTSNLLTSSVLIANSMDCISTTAECPMEAEQWPTVSCAPTGQFHDPYFQQQISPATLITPPPELEARGFPPPLYSYNWQQPTTPYGGQQTSIPISDCYLRGSSLDDSPLSSPGSCDGASIQETPQYTDATYHHGQATVPTRSRSPLVDHVYGLSSTQSNGIMAAEGLGYVLSSCGTTVSGFGGTCSMVTVAATNRDGMDNTVNIPKGVKMPQRKGGIQLWQFLYSLLTDPGKKYCDIIEWTANMREREFRMLEPEAIAIWWGHHKNKPNMSYDKFSRSLRYYYDKGILKKIPGERYVYRFLTDPEQMYRHIGTSDSRPKLKPMPQSAKVAMTRYQKEQNLDFSSNNTPIITQAPEPLTKCEEPSTSAASMVDITSSVCTPPPPYSFGTSANTLYVSSVRQCSASTGNLAVDTEFSGNSGTVPMKRSRSLDSAKENTSEKHSIGLTSHSLPANNDIFLSGRLSMSPVSQSECFSTSSTIPTSQVYTSRVGYGYDSYVASQMDSFPIEPPSSSRDYYAPHQTIPTNFVTPPPTTWN